MSRLDEIRQTRIDKTKSLREQGIDPYPAYSDAHTDIALARTNMDQPATVVGRIMALRGHGKLMFADLQDRTGNIQLMLKADVLNESSNQLLHSLDIGDFIATHGIVTTSQRGEVSVQVESLSLLTKSIRPLPDKYHGLKDTEERYRQRYVDLLVNPDAKKVFLIRSRVTTMLRQFLDQHDFVEVETPVLQPLYGGAMAKPFTTHHNVLDCELYLRISDELYLKRLVAGGLERVYEMSKDFRNEGISTQHNPEFTMLEFYWAYADYNQLMDFTVQMWRHIIQEIFGKLEVTYQGQVYDFVPDFPRHTFRDLINDHLQIDINQITDEKDLIQLIKDRKLLPENHTLVGYGKILDDLYKHHIRPHLKGPLFVTDYPVDMIPLAKRKSDDSTKVATFQLVINGSEFLKAYNELNDPQEQRARWEEEQRSAQAGADEYQPIDEDYLRALEYGMPPTAGWGMGIDRFTAFLTDQPNLKDVILFPTLRPEGKEQTTILP